MKVPLKLALERGGFLVIAEPGSELQEILVQSNGGVILKLVGIRGGINGARVGSAAHEGAQDGDGRQRVGGVLVLIVAVVTEPDLRDRLLVDHLGVAGLNASGTFPGVVSRRRKSELPHIRIVLAVLPK